jgi:hypothetical protein
MSRFRAVMWAVSIGVLAVVLAVMLFRIAPMPGAAFALLLAASVGALAALLALIAEVSPAVGAAGGAVAAVLLAAVLGVTISLAPLAPGARHPGLRDLLWAPLFALLATIAVCAAAGFLGVRGGLYLSRRRKGSGPASRPMG